MFKKKGFATCVADVVEKNVGNLNDFLHPEEEPYLDGLSEVASVILKYKDLPVYIIGDYDSDGVNATAILHLGLKRLGIPSKCRIPKRFSEGYGLSVSIVEELTHDRKVNFPGKEGLLITVDNGIASFDAIKTASENGFHVVVTDHHLPPIDENGKMILPPALAILDPHKGDNSVYTDYCGAALAYRLVKELFAQSGTEFRPEDSEDLLVLAGIATVTDVMTLIGANRYLVKESLRLINKGIAVPGLKLLINKKKMVHITEEDYGFSIGPIFNASGRLHDDGASTILKLLTSDEGEDLEELVDLVIATNEERKEIVKEAMKRILSCYGGERPIVIFDPSLGEGIIGIVAGKLTETFQCPSIVFTRTESGILKGSGRSVPGIHLKDTLDSMQDLMLGYGGHAGAAGLSIEEKNLEAFKEAFRAAVGSLPEIDEDLYYDLDIKPSKFTKVIEDLERFAPYGEGNPKPVFSMIVDIPEIRKIGDKTHFMVKGDVFDIVGFGLTEKYEALGSPKKVDSVGIPCKSYWQTKSGDLRVSLKWQLTDLGFDENELPF